jgi:hypothetical protein
MKIKNSTAVPPTLVLIFSLFLVFAGCASDGIMGPEQNDAQSTVIESTEYSQLEALGGSGSPFARYAIGGEFSPTQETSSKADSSQAE